MGFLSNETFEGVYETFHGVEMACKNIYNLVFGCLSENLLPLPHFCICVVREKFFPREAGNFPSRGRVFCVVMEIFMDCDISLQLIMIAPMCALAGAYARIVYVYNYVCIRFLALDVQMSVKIRLKSKLFP